MKKGAVMGMVLTVLVILTLLTTVLLKMPGGVRRQVPRFEARLQSIYMGESAIISEMEQIPAGYFLGEPWNMNLPAVGMQAAGPWEKFFVPVSSGKKVFAIAGAAFRILGISEIRDLIGNFKDNLNKSILDRENLQWKSGSRRFMGQVEQRSEVITGGDLTLDLEGRSSSLNFKCDGSVNVKGKALVDTLRIYSSGPVLLTGSVVVEHLELYGGGHVEVARDFVFSGLLVSGVDISFRDRAAMKYPAVAVSSGGFVSGLRLTSGRYCGGDSLGGDRARNRVVSAREMDTARGLGSARHLPGDSATCLLPASVGGKLLAFRWGLE
ncbi:MAG: hypothetical protein MJY87_10010 [Fibrobacter sp.]|nr:hypothetical protein [Fibrobacter sp.]